MITRIGNLYKESFSGLSRDIWMLAVVTFINRAGTMVVPFLTIYLTGQLEFTIWEAGIVMSCFGAGSAVGSFLGGQLTDKFGYYPVAFWTLLLGGLGFFAFILTKTFIPFCIVVFLQTILADAMRPAILASVAVYGKEESRNREMGLIRLAVNLGWACGPAFAGIIAASWGYHYLFIVDGTTCVLAAFVFIYLLKKKEEKPAKVSNTPKKQMASSPYKDPVFLTFIGLFTLQLLAFVQLFPTVPLYLKQEYLMEDYQIGFLMAMNGGIIFFVEMPLIFLLENRFQKLSLIAFGAFLIGLSFLVFNAVSWIGIVIISMILITFGEIVNFPFGNAYALNRSQANNRGAYMGLFAISFSVAFTIAPTLGTWIIEKYDFATLWYFTALLSGLAAIGFLLLNIYEKNKEEIPVVPLDLMEPEVVG